MRSVFDNSIQRLVREETSPNWCILPNGKKMVLNFSYYYYTNRWGPVVGLLMMEINKIISKSCLVKLW